MTTPKTGRGLQQQQKTRHQRQKAWEKQNNLKKYNYNYWESTERDRKASPSKKLFKYYLNPSPIPKIKSYENGITIIETIYPLYKYEKNLDDEFEETH